MRRTIFDASRPGVGGRAVFDTEFPDSIPTELFAESLLRKTPLSLPELTEVEVVRHYTRLSRENHGLDNGAYPLGSCTMKYNPKRNDAMANLCGFRNAHPHQPADTLPGLWEMMHGLQCYIAELTGMDAVSRTAHYPHILPDASTKARDRPHRRFGARNQSGVGCDGRLHLPHHPHRPRWSYGYPRA